MQFMENLKIIDSNFYKEQGSFTFKLQDESKFDKMLFNILVKSIHELHHSTLSKEERLLISCKIWSIAFEISMALAFDYNPNDAYTIHGISIEERHDYIKYLES
jgi:hypothetical protein